jgi:heme oxygenase
MIVNQYFNDHYIKNHFNALGALYVLEGSVLGGQVISKMIGRAIGTGSNAFSYFNFYGAQTMEKWAAFKNYLDTIPLTEEQKEYVIRSANDTFENFRQHFNNTYAT